MDAAQIALLFHTLDQRDLSGVCLASTMGPFAYDVTVALRRASAAMTMSLVATSRTPSRVKCQFLIGLQGASSSSLMLGVQMVLLLRGASDAEPHATRIG